MAEPTVGLSARISLPVREALEAQSREEKKSFTDIIERAVLEYVDNRRAVSV